MSTIEAILAGSKWVKGRASKAKWKQCSLAAPHALFSVKVITYFMENFLHYIYVTVPDKRDHFRQYFKIELLVLKGRVALKQ